MRALMAVTLLAIIVTSPGPAKAALAWYTCEVLLVGATDRTTTVLRLTHVSSSPAFTGKVFVIAPGDGNKNMFAAAMVAISSGLRLRVRTDLAVAGAPVIDRVYILNQ